jgi:hypothetical protein
MRTAGLWPPLMVTRPTPFSCAILGEKPRIDEVLDFGERHGFEVIARVRTGASAGLVLL